jgi:hypothetical protein
MAWMRQTSYNLAGIHENNLFLIDRRALSYDGSDGLGIRFNCQKLTVVVGEWPVGNALRVWTCR